MGGVEHLYQTTGLLANRSPVVPNKVTIWDWLFDPDSPDSPLNQSNDAPISGYTNAATKERLDYQRVRECTTLLSTALVKRYGLQPGETVALFSPNTVWYPVAMLGTIRIGKSPDRQLYFRSEDGIGREFFFFFGSIYRH